MRLIDADELRKDVLELPDCPNGYSDTFDKSLIIALVDEAPTVDAVPVIRCKDCKWWSPNRETCIEWADYCFREGRNCILTHFSCRESDYCSWAKRKEE